MQSVVTGQAPKTWSGKLLIISQYLPEVSFKEQGVRGGDRPTPSHGEGMEPECGFGMTSLEGGRAL